MMSSMWEHYELERVSNDVINVGAMIVLMILLYDLL